jgi:hypothetical protein
MIGHNCQLSVVLHRKTTVWVIGADEILDGYYGKRLKEVLACCRLGAFSPSQEIERSPNLTLLVWTKSNPFNSLDRDASLAVRQVVFSRKNAAVACFFSSSTPVRISITVADRRDCRTHHCRWSQRCLFGASRHDCNTRTAPSH